MRDTSGGADGRHRLRRAGKRASPPEDGRVAVCARFDAYLSAHPYRIRREPPAARESGRSLANGQRAAPAGEAARSPRDHAPGFPGCLGDTTKAIGTVTIFLYGPSGRGLPEGEEAATQQRRYDIDLRDLKRNAELFDPATRTYRIPLSGLPAWIGTASDPARLTLRAEMTCVRPDGTSNLLVDEYLVTK